MFIKALSISTLIASIFGLLLVAVDFYNSLNVDYKPIIQIIVAFIALVALVYAILWLDKHPMPDSYDN